MQRRSLLIGSLGAIGFSAISGGSQVESSEDAIWLRFPERADLTGLSIRYFLTGPFGGYGSFVRTDPTVREYTVETWHNGQRARTLKVIVYCPGYRVVLFEELALAERTDDSVSIQLEPLGRVPLSGHVASVAGLPGLTIEAVYTAYWSHEFFGIVDGGVASFSVATAEVASDGTFQLDLPDLAHDPVEVAFGRKGRIHLMGRDTDTAYWIRDRRTSEYFSLPIMEEYSVNHLFTLVPLPR